MAAGAREHPGWKPQPFCNLNLEVTAHRFCHMPFIRSESLGPATLKGRGLHWGTDTRKWGALGSSQRPPYHTSLTLGSNPFTRHTSWISSLENCHIISCIRELGGAGVCVCILCLCFQAASQSPTLPLCPLPSSGLSGASWVSDLPHPQEGVSGGEPAAGAVLSQAHGSGQHVRLLSLTPFLWACPPFQVTLCSLAPPAPLQAPSIPASPPSDRMALLMPPFSEVPGNAQDPVFPVTRVLPPAAQDRALVSAEQQHRRPRRAAPRPGSVHAAQLQPDPGLPQPGLQPHR